jgi:sec-independent protein translocase protein TatA
MFSNLGTTELIVIVAVLFIFFGGKKLPEFARGLGEAGRELKKANKEVKQAFMDDDESAGEE